MENTNIPDERRPNVIGTCPRCGKDFYFASISQEAEFRSAWSMWMSTGKDKWINKCKEIEAVETIHTCTPREEGKE